MFSRYLFSFLHFMIIFVMSHFFYKSFELDDSCLLASYCLQSLEEEHGNQYSVARQLGLLHSDLAKWLSGVQAATEKHGKDQHRNPTSAPSEPKFEHDAIQPTQTPPQAASPSPHAAVASLPPSPESRLEAPPPPSPHLDVAMASLISRGSTVESIATVGSYISSQPQSPVSSSPLAPAFADAPVNTAIRLQPHSPLHDITGRPVQPRSPSFDLLRPGHGFPAAYAAASSPSILNSTSHQIQQQKQTMASIRGTLTSTLPFPAASPVPHMMPAAGLSLMAMATQMNQETEMRRQQQASLGEMAVGQLSASAPSWGGSSSGFSPRMGTSAVGSSIMAGFPPAGMQHFMGPTGALMTEVGPPANSWSMINISPGDRAGGAQGTAVSLMVPVPPSSSGGDPAESRREKPGKNKSKKGWAKLKALF